MIWKIFAIILGVIALLLLWAYFVGIRALDPYRDYDRETRKHIDDAAACGCEYDWDIFECPCSSER